MTDRTLNGRRIRGLTLHRPWPWAFTHGGKRVENRTWKPPPTIVGGYIALHAGKRFDPIAAERIYYGDFGVHPHLSRSPDAHPHSVIVAVAKLVGFREHHSSDPEGWAFGPYVWKLPDVTLLSEPVPCKGAQGLWKLPDDVFDAVARQCADSFRQPRGKPAHGG